MMSGAMGSKSPVHPNDHVNMGQVQLNNYIFTLLFSQNIFNWELEQHKHFLKSCNNLSTIDPMMPSLQQCM